VTIFMSGKLNDINYDGGVRCMLHCQTKR
jgi:hypothetical protein